MNDFFLFLKPTPQKLILPLIVIFLPRLLLLLATFPLSGIFGFVILWFYEFPLQHINTALNLNLPRGCGGGNVGFDISFCFMYSTWQGFILMSLIYGLIAYLISCFIFRTSDNPTTFVVLAIALGILAGITIFVASLSGAYLLGRSQQILPTIPPRVGVEESATCQTDSDCILAINLGAACCGVGVYSKEQLQRNKNLVPYAEYEKNKEKYRRSDSGVVCKICSPIPEAVICDRGVSVNSCRGASKIEADLSYEARKAVNLAKEDLAKNLNIDIRKIALNRVQEITWPDSSMGCSKPEEGVSLPVITPGYQIFLQAYGIVYDYRAGKGGEQGYYIRPCSTQLAIDCAKDSDCSQGLVCVGKGPTQPSKETPGICLSQKQSQGVQ